MKKREKVLEEIRSNSEFDLIIIGGGASGIGTALEACLRGYRTLLLEKDDYTKGTSSKSTKLVHGGVRYMAQGDLKMVREALKERGRLIKNAPHLVHDQSFIIPNYRHWDSFLYGVGLTFYDLLAGKYSLGRSKIMNKKTTKTNLIGITPKGLKSGVLYHDGQFDDSRLAMDMLHSFFENGGLALNYFEVKGLLKDGGKKLRGITGIDVIGNENISVQASAIVNATGVWADDILSMDNPAHEKTIRPSQGIHLVLDSSFLPGKHALMIPKTSDGRVLFAVPWHGHLVVGTTDTPIDENSSEPVALEKEIQFVLDTAALYFKKEIKRSDVLSVFAGLRPLAAPKDGSSKTKEISRNHKVIVSESGMISVIGGKWTTYRKMAQDIIDTAVKQKLVPTSNSNSKDFPISDKCSEKVRPELEKYGNHACEIEALIEADATLSDKLHPNLPYLKAELVWACKNEMVVHLEDILARRLRSLLLNARISIEIAEEAARLAGPHLGWNAKKQNLEVEAFRKLAGNYVLEGVN